MRKYQLTINLDCFDVPGKKKTFRIYTDANSVWEVVCSGFRRLIEHLNKEDYQLPSFGVINSDVKEEGL